MINMMVTLRNIGQSIKSNYHSVRRLYLCATWLEMKKNVRKILGYINVTATHKYCRIDVVKLELSCILLINNHFWCIFS